MKEKEQFRDLVIMKRNSKQQEPCKIPAKSPEQEKKIWG